MIGRNQFQAAGGWFYPVSQPPSERWFRLRPRNLGTTLCGGPLRGGPCTGSSGGSGTTGTAPLHACALPALPLVTTIEPRRS